MGRRTTLLIVSDARAVSGSAPPATRPKAADGRLGSRTLRHLLPPLGVVLALALALLAADVALSSVVPYAWGVSFTSTVISLGVIAVGDAALGAWLERWHVRRATRGRGSSTARSALRASRAGAVVIGLGCLAALLVWLGSNRLGEVLGVGGLMSDLTLLGFVVFATFLLLGLGYALGSIRRHRRAD